MSDIYGDGYGSTHNWRMGYQGYGDKSTPYTCKDCGAHFRHWYDFTPNIFEAIKACEVPEKCEVGHE